MSAEWWRNLVLAAPLVCVLVVVVIKRKQKVSIESPLALSAGLVVFVGILLVESVSPWWSFQPAATGFLGIPLEVTLGWSLLWGAVPALVPAPWPMWLASFAWIDLLVMPRMTSLVQLGPGWLWGELVLLLGVATPSLILISLTRSQRMLWVRVAIQAAAASLLALWLVPTMAFARSGSWEHVLSRGPLVIAVLTITSLVFGGLAAAGVWQLAADGGGTPYPWDPPVRLVTTGVYAYLANPIQTGMIGVLGLLAIASGSWTLGVAVGLAVAFCLSVAQWHERELLSARWTAYDEYRGRVRSWLPRLTAYQVKEET